MVCARSIIIEGDRLWSLGCWCRLCCFWCDKSTLIIIKSDEVDSKLLYSTVPAIKLYPWHYNGLYLQERRERSQDQWADNIQLDYYGGTGWRHFKSVNMVNQIMRVCWSPPRCADCGQWIRWQIQFNCLVSGIVLGTCAMNCAVHDREF